MRTDFRLEDWIVRPRRGCIERAGGVVHVHPRPMAVLEILADAAGQVVTRDELFEAAWPGLVVSDDALTQCIVELRKAFRDPAHDPRIIQTVPRVGFRLIPPALPLEAGPTDPVARRRSWALAAVAALLVAVIAIVAWNLIRPSQRALPVQESRPTLAVLPFVDLSAAQDQAYFADGLAEQLINVMARLPALNVIGRSSSFRFRGMEQDLEVIRHSLGISHALEGSVRRQGEQLRVSVQLLAAETGYQLWGKTYDRRVGDVFEIQEDIAAEIRAALARELDLPETTSPRVSSTADQNAYDAFLRGRFLLAKRTIPEIEEAIVQLERATSIDPEFAGAHAELAMAYPIFRYYGGNLSISSVMERAVPHAVRALSLNPGLPSAHTAMGGLKRLEGKREEALSEFSLAIEAGPSYALAHTWSANTLEELGRYSESFVMLERALNLDPWSIGAIVSYFNDLLDRGRLQDAEWEMEKLATLHPVRYVWCRSYLDGVQGQWSRRAIGAVQSYVAGPDSSYTRRSLIMILAVLGLEAEVRQLGAESPEQLPLVLPLLGLPEEAREVSERRLAERPDAKVSLRMVGRSLAAEGRYVDARPLLEALWDGAGGRVTRLGEFRAEDALALFVIRREAGDELGAREVLDALQDNLRRYREAGITMARLRFSPDVDEGLIALLLGDSEHGLELVSRGMDDGYFMIGKEAYLEDLYAIPRFEALLERQQGRVAEERNRFLDWACVESPVSDQWRPAQGTCEALIAARVAGGN